MNTSTEERPCTLISLADDFFAARGWDGGALFLLGVMRDADSDHLFSEFHPHPWYMVYHVCHASMGPTHVNMCYTRVSCRRRRGGGKTRGNRNERIV